MALANMGGYLRHHGLCQFGLRKGCHLELFHVSCSLFTTVANIRQHLYNVNQPGNSHSTRNVGGIIVIIIIIIITIISISISI